MIGIAVHWGLKSIWGHVNDNSIAHSEYGSISIRNTKLQDESDPDSDPILILSSRRSPWILPFLVLLASFILLVLF